MHVLLAIYYRSLKPETLMNAYLRENGKTRRDIINELYMGQCVGKIVELVTSLYETGHALNAREIQKQVDELQGNHPLGYRVWQTN